jgi:isoquinoline 1-oxidoreductase beta subunit
MAPPGAAYRNALLGSVQLTGDSSSVRDGWQTLRRAGALMRAQLVAAAAQRWQLPASALRTQNGRVLGPHGETADYGALAAAAARLRAPADVRLKDPKDWVLIGRPTKLLDTPAKVAGTAEYGIDVRMPGMVHASLLQCPVLGGVPRSVDPAKALAAPGVIDVVRIPEGVAVVADTWWHARKARDLLAVQWDEGPAKAVTTDGIFEGLHSAVDGSRRLLVHQAGNPDPVIDGATNVIRAEYRMPLLAHATMEPMNFTGFYRAGKLELAGPTQWQDTPVETVSRLLGIAPADITLRTTFLGGGFGRRIDFDYLIQAARIARAVPDRPVKLLWTREDDMTHDVYRPASLHRLAAAIGPDGMPTAFTFRMASQSIAERLLGLPADAIDHYMIEAAVAPYAIPASRHEIVKHPSGIKVGYWRSVSHMLNAFANESFIDELAVAAKRDPYLYRMALLRAAPRHANVLRLAAEKTLWTEAAPAGRFRGIAVMNGYDTYMALVAEISMRNGAILVHRVTVACDCGRVVNPATVEAQIQSSVVFGLSAVLFGEIHVDGGQVRESNFHQVRLLRIGEMPEVDIVLSPSGGDPGGIGEPAVALLAPAVANALFAATGKRLRRLPLSPENIANA